MGRADNRLVLTMIPQRLEALEAYATKSVTAPNSQLGSLFPLERRMAKPNSTKPKTA
jgi:hypothetical protein